MHTRLRFSLTALGVAAFALLADPQHASAGMIYSQPTNEANGFASQNDTSGGLGNYATVYDDFTLPAAAIVTGVEWDGVFFNFRILGTITQFTLAFYANNAGTPGTLLLSESTPGNANQTSLGTVNVIDPLFSYSATLPTPFAASAGTEYWLSIVPDLGFPPQWAWAEGTGGTGTAYQVFRGRPINLGNDVAFSLDGNLVSSAPAPPSVIPLLTGALGLLGYGWRRRRRPAA
jgi:MYXO-CTERM domain-containing protein